MMTNTNALTPRGGPELEDPEQARVPNQRSTRPGSLLRLWPRASTARAARFQSCALVAPSAPSN
jgi:hypothetical protein